MNSVRVTWDYGIVIRKSAFQARGISRETVLNVMETEQPLDENDELMSLGPHFGGDAVREFTRRLETLGLRLNEDFISFVDMLPAWCQVHFAVKNSV